MKYSILVVPTLLVYFGVFLISAGVGLMAINNLFPIFGFILGVISFLLAGKAKDKLK
ncbi:hypothetical protein [Virgibacillus sp. CBA3643]|uniref:hypothetical protein n=1 Tax=Virgibacillus sp. CBA3643 TaxID=2942278 RepID=UPI0035A32BD3